MKSFFKSLLVMMGLAWALGLQASHIRALEITARRISPSNLTFEITVTGYRDVSGVLFANGKFNFGDGTSTESIPWTNQGNIGNNTEKWQFVLVHTYQGPGAYLLSYEEPFRNNGIINMANSGGTNFYNEALILIDPIIGVNSTPVLTVPPVDLGAKGLIYIHNPGAFDADGDSLSYRFTTPKQGRNFDVTGYLSLIHPTFYTNFNQGNEEQNGPPTLTLDPATGDLIWNAPGAAGEYNVAFIIEEWRKINGTYIRLGYVVRDMQIIIVDTDNQRPTLDVPDPICVIAGELVEATITGDDPDGHPVRLSAFGGPFEVPSPATFRSPTTSVPQPQGPPGSLEFEWQTICGHVRASPYQVQFKVEDVPANAPRLVDFETWEITVIGPAPTGLTTTLQPGRQMLLTWDAYSCPNASLMQVWRRVGEFPYTPDECETGIRANAGYELVATVPINQTAYMDTNGGLGLASGANYCYRLVAVFPQPTGGLSVVSEEACDEIVSNAPIITHVDVLTTSETAGSVYVEWIEPLELDDILFPGPYTYDVQRSAGLNPGTFTTVATGITDLFYTDLNLNTDDLAYTYQIIMYDNTDTEIETSFPASSVRLELRPFVGGIDVTWSAKVPWSNARAGLLHDIYRDKINPGDPAELVLIASVDVTQTGFRYRDDGSHNGEPLDEEQLYCYFVTARGSYDNPAIPEPLVNNSQIQCAQPNDEIPPCTPVDFGFDPDFVCEETVAFCDLSNFSNTLNWQLDMSGDCQDDVVSFNIYFSLTGAEGTFQFLANATGTQFVHSNLRSFKGCYRIAAVDRSGNESELSAPLCNDNCPSYVLPNVFTPNNDGVNDLFTAYGTTRLTECPRFVESVFFEVFDRTGKKLYSYNSREAAGRENTNPNLNPIYINWDGKATNGKDLPAGTYFYQADVVFDVLDPKQAKKTFKGWVQILR
jgi:gliding motility-associated-like protein